MFVSFHKENVWKLSLLLFYLSAGNLYSSVAERSPINFQHIVIRSWISLILTLGWTDIKMIGHSYFMFRSHFQAIQICKQKTIRASTIERFLRFSYEYDGHTVMVVIWWWQMDCTYYILCFSTFVGEGASQFVSDSPICTHSWSNLKFVELFED